MLTEEAAEGGTVGNAALLNDESDRVVGRGEQAGSMTDAVLVDKVGRRQTSALVKRFTQVGPQR